MKKQIAIHNHPFTPGEWAVDVHPAAVFIKDAEGNIIAELKRYGVGVTNQSVLLPWHLAERNARLMAMAPKLLATLETLVNLDAGLEDGGSGIMPDDWYVARSVVQEAKQVAIDTPCPHCGREENGTWFTPCPSDDCPSHEEAA